MLLLQELNWTRRDWMEQWTSSVASPSGLHKEDLCSSKESLYKILHCTHHINILPIIEQNLCHYMAFIAKEGMMANQVLSLSSAPPAHRGGVGHPKHGGYAETRVGDQRDKKSSGKDRSCSTQEANDSEVAGETEDNVARKGPGWPDAVGSSIPLLSWILEVGGDHHTH